MYSPMILNTKAPVKNKIIKKKFSKKQNNFNEESERISFENNLCKYIMNALLF